MRVTAVTLGATRQLTPRRSSITRAAGNSRGRQSFTNSFIDFFDDLTEGARDGPRSKGSQKDDVADFTDLPAEAKEAAAALEGLWADAWKGLDVAAGSLSSRLSGLNAELADGRKDVNTVVDDVIQGLSQDVSRLFSPVTRNNKQAAASIQAVLSSAASRGSNLKQEVQGGIKTAAEAADELGVIVKAAFDELRSLLLSLSAAEASAAAADVAAAAADAADVAADAAAAIADALGRNRPVAPALQLETLKAAVSDVTTKMANLSATAAGLQQQAAAGKLSAAQAVDHLLEAFLHLLNSLRASVAGGSSSSSMLAALDRCQDQAMAGANMVRDTVAQQERSSAEAAVKHLNRLLQQLALDLSAELVALGPAEAAAVLQGRLPGVRSRTADSSTDAAGAAAPREDGQKLGSSRALQELQEVLAGGVEQGLAGGVATEALTAVAGFLSFLSGRTEAAADSVRRGRSSTSAAVREVRALTTQRAEGLRQALSALPDARLGQAAAREVEGAVAALEGWLQALEADLNNSTLTQDEALAAFTDAVVATSSQLQQSMQQQVFGGMDIALPQLPGRAAAVPAQGGVRGASSGQGLPRPARSALMGALNSAARVINGVIAAAESSSSSSKSRTNSSSSSSLSQSSASAAATAVASAVAASMSTAVQVVEAAGAAASEGGGAVGGAVGQDTLQVAKAAEDLVADLAGKAQSLKAAVASGKADATVVVDNAVSQLKATAAALKKTSAGNSADAAAAIDAAVADFESKAKALKAAVASGKADAALAVDEALFSLASEADELKHVVTAANMDHAVKELTGKVAGLKAAINSGACEDAAAALDALLADFNNKLQQSAARLGPPDSHAAAGLQAALAPITAAAASLQAALAQPGRSSSSTDAVAHLFDKLEAAAGGVSSSIHERVGDALGQEQLTAAAARTLLAAEGVSGKVQKALARLSQQLPAAGQDASSPEAAQEAEFLLEAAVEAVAAQVAQLKMTGLASIEGSDSAAPLAAAVDQLADGVMSKGQQLVSDVRAGQLQGGPALDELLLVVQDTTSNGLRAAVVDSLAVRLGDNSSSSSSRSELSARLNAAVAAARAGHTPADELQGLVAVGRLAGRLVNVVVGVAALQLVKDVAGTVLQQAGIVMPSAVGGMVGLTGLLFVFGPRAGGEMVQFYDTYLGWTSKLLPLFYVPALAVLPVLLHGMSGDDVAALLAITAAGAVTSLLFTAVAAVMLLAPQDSSSNAGRPAAANAGSNTPPQPAAGAAIPKHEAGLAAAVVAAFAPLALTKHDPAAFGEAMAIPAGLAWSVLGWAAAQDWKQHGGAGGGCFLLHPMVAGALAANLGVFWHSVLAGGDYVTAMQGYLGQGFGAGDLLMSLVGPALTGLAFVVYKHRRQLALPGLAATVLLSSLFSVIATLGASNLLGMTAGWTKALLPRHITDAVAADVARSVGASIHATGLAVLLQAGLAVSLGGLLCKACGGAVSAAARGAAAGCTAGAVGAAGLCDDEPVALAHGAVAYALVSVLVCCVLRTPALREALVAAAATAV